MRDVKAIREREQALRLLRAVIALPPPPRPIPLNRSSTSRTRRASASGHSRHPSGHGHARNPSGGGHPRNPSSKGHSRTTPDPVTVLLDKRVPITDGLVRAIVSSAENPDDPMRIACMETLVEIGASTYLFWDWSHDEVGLLDLRCLVLSDAFRTLLLAFKDGPPEFTPCITGLLVYLANQPSTRQHLLPGSDLEVSSPRPAFEPGSSWSGNEDGTRWLDGRVWQAAVSTTSSTGGNASELREECWVAPQLLVR